MQERFSLESFDSLAADWRQLQRNSPNSHIFSSVEWSQVWWQHFGAGSTLYLGSVRKQGTTVGIAPLRIKGDTAFFIGSTDVCDYMDFIVKPGEEEYFFEIVLENIMTSGAGRLTLASVRPDSTVVTKLLGIAQRQGLPVALSQKDSSVELALPATWEEYLMALTTKQRHELKRKMRRLAEMGNIQYRSSTDANPSDIDVFLRLFRDSRKDKAAFLTQRMEAFFRSLFNTLAQVKLLRLNILELNATQVAATMCFDYNDTVYLYNSGYDPEFRWLSAGVVSKALCIEDSIQRGKKRFDFLKGNEEYKYHLGGNDVPLYECSLTFYRAGQS